MCLYIIFSDFNISIFQYFQIFRFSNFQISYIFKSSFVFYYLIMGLIVFLREEIQREKTKKIIDMFQSIIFLLFFVVFLLLFSWEQCLHINNVPAVRTSVFG
jgi:uncharacterized membrane protein